MSLTSEGLTSQCELHLAPEAEEEKGQDGRQGTLGNLQTQG